MQSKYDSDISQALKIVITITVMLAAIIEIIDTTIVNVVLHNISGAIGASNEEVTWVVTSYIVAAAICMPLTGFLIKTIGRKKLLLINIFGFMFFSILCGISSSLLEIIVFRIFQGIFGASLVPLSMYVLRNIYSQEEQIKAMAIWGIGIMAAPVLGPTIGGYIADYASWRWVFYINIPICLIAILLTSLFITESDVVKSKIDWMGLIILITTIGSFQIFLDRGNPNDWFDSNSITLLCIVSILGIITFITRGSGNKKNIINLDIYLNLDYSISSALVFLLSAGIFGIMTIQPMLMEGYMNYSAKLTGIIMAPRGIVAALGMIIVTSISKRIDIRYIISAGVILTAYGLYMYSKLSLNTNMIGFIIPEIYQGLGMAFFFAPLSSIALRSLDKGDIAEASGMFSFSRNLATSAGISILVTIFTRNLQSSWSLLSKHITNSNQNYTNWIQHTNMSNEKIISLKLKSIIVNQSSIIAFNHAALIASIVVFLSLILIPFIKNP